MVGLLHPRFEPQAGNWYTRGKREIIRRRKTMRSTVNSWRVGVWCLVALLVGCGETKIDEHKNIKDGKNVVVPSRKEYPNMVFIPAGEFLMSTSSTDQGRRRVHLKAFYIDIYEVSNAQYEGFISDGGYAREELWSKEGWAWRSSNGVTMPKWWKTGRYRIGPMHPDYPVGGVSWYEAEAFARWAGKRLPTEAEWEMASRGMDGRLFPWGNDPVDADGVYRANFEPVNDGNMHAGRIDSYPLGKSPWGCFNMLGNVWEWVADSATKNGRWYRTLPDKNPVFTAETGYKLMRGGSWYKGFSVYDYFFRLAIEPGVMAYDDFGFRCARDAD